MPENPAHADATALTLAAVAAEAGRLLRGLEASTTEGRLKADGTPTTAADLAAEHLILERLHAFFPGIPAIAEETCAAEAVGETFFLVDPLDGTGDYLRGTGEYTVNIALVCGDRPVAAVVAAPALGRIWIAGDAPCESALREDGDFAWTPVRARPAPDRDLVALVSRRYGDEATEACLSRLAVGARRPASSALKFCLIASGEADVYVRCGPTMEWDTAAGDHILSRAGGSVVGAGGARLTYGHHGRAYRNGPFAAVGDAALAARVGALLTPSEGRGPAHEPPPP